MKEPGWKQRDIAVALGLTEGVVSQWLKKAREGGPDALLVVPHPGKVPQLSDEQLTQLRTLMEQGAQGAWQPEGTPLHEVIRRQLASFLKHFDPPAFVESTFLRFPHSAAVPPAIAQQIAK